jgi:membrane protein DedA with SNARE-associated domain
MGFLGPRAQASVTRQRWAHWLLLALFVVASVATAIFGLRAYHSLQLLRSAYAVGAPGVSSIRPWMTLRYVASTYRAPQAALIEHLGLAAETQPDTSLRTLAEQAGLAPVQYVQRVQQAVADVAPALGADRTNKTTSWLSAVGDRFLAALLVYGYPILGLTLLLGAIGLPLPTGLSTAVAGSLAAQGQLSWLWASTIAVTSSVAGDMIGYGLGHVLGLKFLERRGHWLGYTPARRARVEQLFSHWGVLTVLLSRTLVSHLSSVVSLLAGSSRYRLYEFLALAIVGRMLWTSAYLALGYGVGGDLDAATAFLKNLTGLLVSLAILVGLGLAAFNRSNAATVCGH